MHISLLMCFRFHLLEYHLFKKDKVKIITIYNNFKKTTLEINV